MVFSSWKFATNGEKYHPISELKSLGIAGKYLLLEIIGKFAIKMEKMMVERKEHLEAHTK